MIAFDCAGDRLFATLDGAGKTGVLIVSGGNEVRAGPHRSMALLAARLAPRGVAVMRYDRRGVGDSGGPNRGFAHGRDDLAAALALLRREGAGRIVGYGNCDAATLLALEGRALGVDALVLANPWTGAQPDALPPAAAIRARYAAKLRSPREWRRLLTGGVDLAKLGRGLAKSWRARPDPLAPRLVRAVEGWGDDAIVILAARDATALAFAAAARGSAVAPVIVPTASHSFARPGDMDAVEAAIRRMARAP